MREETYFQIDQDWPADRRHDMGRLRNILFRTKKQALNAIQECLENMTDEEFLEVGVDARGCAPNDQFYETRTVPETRRITRDEDLVELSMGTQERLLSWENSNPWDQGEVLHFSMCARKIVLHFADEMDFRD